MTYLPRLAPVSIDIVITMSWPCFRASRACWEEKELGCTGTSPLHNRATWVCLHRNTAYHSFWVQYPPWLGSPSPSSLLRENPLTTVDVCCSPGPSWYSGGNSSSWPVNCPTYWKMPGPRYQRSVGISAKPRYSWKYESLLAYLITQ